MIKQDTHCPPAGWPPGNVLRAAIVRRVGPAQELLPSTGTSTAQHLPTPAACKDAREILLAQLAGHAVHMQHIDMHYTVV